MLISVFKFPLYTGEGHRIDLRSTLLCCAAIQWTSSQDSESSRCGEEGLDARLCDRRSRKGGSAF